MKNPKPSKDLNRTELMLAYLCIKDEKSLASQVEILDRLGIDTNDISKISGAANQTIRNVRVKSKKKKDK
jgi:hypothetical protein